MEQVSKLIKAAPVMEKRRLCMMGNGKTVQPKFVERFCKTVANDCLDGRCRGYEDFALGVIACLDALSRGTIDLEEHPRNVVKQMWNDVNNVTTLPNKVTDITRVEG